MSTTDLASPGTGQVTDRAYRVRYSFLTEPMTVRYLLSSDQTADPDDVVLGSEQIDPGPAGTLGLHAGPGPGLNIPAGHGPCDAYVLAVIDPDATLDETDEDNNFFALPVTVSEDGNPDRGTNGIHP